MRKVSAAPEVAGAPKDVRRMFLYDPPPSDKAKKKGFGARLGELFATHPPIEARIAAIERFGLGRAAGAGAAQAAAGGGKAA